MTKKISLDEARLAEREVAKAVAGLNQAIKVAVDLGLVVETSIISMHEVGRGYCDRINVTVKIRPSLIDLGVEADQPYPPKR